MDKFAAIEIGGTKLQLVVGDESARVIDRRRFNVDPASGAAGIRQQIEQSLPELMRAHHPSAVGVGFGGPVDWRNGRIAKSHQIEGWSGFELTRWLRRLADVPVAVDNDGNVAALGEALHGAGRGLNPVFYVTLGSGVGGGLVLDGAIYHGATPGESELGHVRLDRQGTIVEARCSGWAVDRRIRALRGTEAGRGLYQRIGNEVRGEARFLGPALAEKDPAAENILRDTAEDLALGLSHVTHLFHPGIIVIGGGLSHLGEPLRAAVQAALTPLLMEVFQPGPTVALAGLGEDAVPVGALALAKAASKA